MRILLIRHADSQHGQSGRILAPHECPGLSLLGMQQAERLARRLRASGEISDCTHLLCSRPGRPARRPF